MAARDAAGSQTKRLHRDDLRAVQGEQPMRGPDEFLVVVIGAVRGVAHHLGHRQFRHRFVERGLQCTDERAALGDVGVIEYLDLAVVLAD